MRLVEFRRFLDNDNALRARFELGQGHVLKFMVQLECRFEDNAGAPSEAWCFLQGESPCRVRFSQPPVLSVA